MKILNKGTIIGFGVGLLTVAGFVYAAQTITSLTQTASTGDKITANWVNAVNTKLNTVSASGAGPFCVNQTNAGVVADTLKSYGTPTTISRANQGTFINGSVRLSRQVTWSGSDPSLHALVMAGYEAPAEPSGWKSLSLNTSNGTRELYFCYGS